MGGFKVLTLIFPQNRFATLAGIMTATGTLGNLLAASPLAWAASFMGWRAMFVLVGILPSLFGLLLYWTLRLPAGAATPSSPSEGPLTIASSMRLILPSFAFWQIAVLALFRYGIFVSLQGVWLGLYLIDVKGLSPLQSGHILVSLSLGYIIGSPVTGRLYDRFSSHGKSFIVAGHALYALSLLPLLNIWPVHGFLSFVLIAFSIGFFGTSGTLLYTNVKELFPLSVAGTAMTWVNFFVMAGGALLVSLFGNIIDRYPHAGHSYPPEAYHLCFLICFCFMVISLIFYILPGKGRSRV
jgi:predicted MFS family arabinose efflux permease